MIVGPELFALLRRFSRFGEFRGRGLLDDRANLATQLLWDRERVVYLRGRKLYAAAGLRDSNAGAVVAQRALLECQKRRCVFADAALLIRELSVINRPTAHATASRWEAVFYSS